MWFRKKPTTTEGSDTPAPVNTGVERMHTWVRGGLERSLRPVRATRGSSWIVAGYIALLVADQLTLAYVERFGLVFNIVVLFVLVAGALLSENLRKLSVSLAILPVAYMATSSFTTHNAFQKAAVFYGLLLVLTLVYRYLFTLEDDVERSRLKLRGHAFGLPLMLIMGEVAGVVGYAFLRHQYPYGHISLPLVAIASIVFAITEEMLLRGLVQKEAEKVVTPSAAVGLASVLYAALAFNSQTLLSIGPAIVMGVVLALVYKFKQNLLLSIAINAAAKLTYIGLIATFVLR